MSKWTHDDGGDVNNRDGLAYAQFLDKFAQALHKEHLELSLDFFTDLAIWNLAAMNGVLGLADPLQIISHAGLIYLL
jgi:hypothetical protein